MEYGSVTSLLTNKDAFCKLPPHVFKMLVKTFRINFFLSLLLFLFCPLKVFFSLPSWWRWLGTWSRTSGCCCALGYPTLEYPWIGEKMFVITKGNGYAEPKKNWKQYVFLLKKMAWIIGTKQRKSYYIPNFFFNIHTTHLDITPGNDWVVNDGEPLGSVREAPSPLHHALLEALQVDAHSKNMIVYPRELRAYEGKNRLSEGNKKFRQKKENPF